MVDLPRGGSCAVCSTPRAAAPWGMCRAESRVMSTPRCCGGAAEEGLHVRSLRSKKTDAMHALISAGCARRKGAGEHDGIDEPCFSPERVETASPFLATLTSPIKDSIRPRTAASESGEGDLFDVSRCVCAYIMTCLMPRLLHFNDVLHPKVRERSMCGSFVSRHSISSRSSRSNRVAVG